MKVVFFTLFAYKEMISHNFIWGQISYLRSDISEVLLYILLFILYLTFQNPCDSSSNNNSKFPNPSSITDLLEKIHQSFAKFYSFSKTYWLRVWLKEALGSTCSVLDCDFMCVVPWLWPVLSWVSTPLPHTLYHCISRYL